MNREFLHKKREKLAAYRQNKYFFRQKPNNMQLAAVYFSFLP